MTTTIATDHGPDLRDWFNAGHTWDNLLHLAGEERPVQGETVKPHQAPNEAIDDPHRLARVNLAQYATATGGRTLRYWRGEWYVWKQHRYQKIQSEELRAKITNAVKEEFDRAWEIANEKYEEWKNGDKYDPRQDKGPPMVKKVTPHVVSGVVNATASMRNVLIPSSVEPMTWLEGREKRNYVAMRNGLIDLDAVLEGKEESDCVLPHSTNWFSVISLPYAFDADAKCPRWEAFLERNLEMDPERIKLVQEWAGYLLTSDTGQQRFLVFEGEGANGKSVYCAAIAGMLGSENCSFVPLEVFGDRFSKTSTLGRLVNISADAGEIDKLAEGFVKSFTSGDPMMFDRKGLSPLECVPTARLMVACNQRPRFTDKSDGVWRRMIPVPWRIQIPENEQIANMDKAWWWLAQGELPGIFNWALVGLARLRSQGRFTKSQVVSDTLEDYRTEMNPAKSFLDEFVEDGQSGTIRSSQLYGFYKRWIAENGYRPLSERQFFKEVKRKFVGIEKKRGGTRHQRFWYYEGIQFSQDEICGEEVENNTLF